MQRFLFTQLALLGWAGLLSALSAWGAGNGGTTGSSTDPVESLTLSTNANLDSPGPGDLDTGPSARARAGQWNFSAGARGTLTLTDNVNLAPSGQEKADLVLGLSLPLGLQRQGARLKVFAEYIPTVYLYGRTRESDNLQNNLRSLVSLEAVDDLFFVDASANVYQSYISPFQPRPQSGASITDNRTQQTTLGFSPYLRHQSGRGWQYLLRNDNFWNKYSAEGLADTVSSRVFADILSPARRVRYGFDYTYLYTRDESQPNAYYQQIARVRPILQATRRLTVSARLGYESNDYVTSYSGSVYGAGIDWAPSPRTRMDGFLEHRFFGASYGLNFNHRSRRTAWRLGATRNTYTTAEQPLTLRPGTTAEVLDDAFRSKIADPVQREQAVRQFLERAGLPPSLTQPYTFYTNQVYLAEQVTGSVALLGRRNTIELTLFWQQNEPITAGGDALPDVFVAFNQFRQRGATLTLTHRLSGLTSVALNATRLYALSGDPSGTAGVSQIESTQDTVRLIVTHQLSAQSNGSIGLRWANFDSSTNPYHELAILALLAHSF